MTKMEERGISIRVVFGWLALPLLVLAFFLAVSVARHILGPDPRVVWIEQREQARQAIRDEVAQETVAESVRNLLLKDLSPIFSPHWRSLMHMNLEFNAMRLSEELEADPRIAKLLDIIEHGSQEDVDALYDELLNVIDTFLFDLPLKTVYGMREHQASVRSPLSGDAIPMLLAAFPASVEHLNLLLAMADRIYLVHIEDIFSLRGLLDPEPSNSFESMRSDSTVVLAYHIEHILSGLADQEPEEELYSQEQNAVLEVFRQHREEQRAVTRAVIEDQVEQGWAYPDAFEIIGDDLRLLDALAWNYSYEVGLIKEPQGSDPPYRLEHETMALAREMRAAN